MGVFSGTKNNIDFTNNRLNVSYYASAKGNRFWAAATVHQGVMEHRDFAAQTGNQFLPPPSGLNIFISSYVPVTSGATPLSHIRAKLELTTAFLRYHLTGNWLTQGAEALVTEVLNRLPIDIAFGTRAVAFAQFDSDWFGETIFHELSHASHYSKAGQLGTASLYKQKLMKMLHMHQDPLVLMEMAPQVTRPSLPWGKHGPITWDIFWPTKIQCRPYRWRSGQKPARFAGGWRLLDRS
ncbi:MAG: hypothetical protein H0X41_12260 [Chitinophagaceae bacterium]|nr:hypothetical protein [Chitinophagaceae bacterium]